MRLLSLDYYPVFGDDATHDSFSSDTSVFDYDAVIWDPAMTMTRYSDSYYQESHEGLPFFSEYTTVKITSDVARRKKEFAEFVDSGRVLIVKVCPPQQCYIDTGERLYSGTDRNRSKTNHLAKFDLWGALPLDNPEIVQARGERIEIVRDNPVSKVLRGYKQYISYLATMSTAPGVVITRIAGTDKAVSSMVTTKNGGVILMLPMVYMSPTSADDQDEDVETTWPPEAAAFQRDLLEALTTLTNGRELSRPSWAVNYATEEQRKLRFEVVKQQERTEHGRRKLALLQQKAEAVEARDQLYLGNGRVLELEVKAVLELLGGTVTDPEPGRDDWQVQFLEGNAVFEVKGVTKSAAEKHAAQLEKWVSSIYETTGAIPKGVLVVNTWRETPLGERNDEDFPAQMLPYCQGRKHCLLTGLDLFLIRAEVEVDPKRAGLWRKKILETTGRLVGIPDWKTIITTYIPGE